MDLDFLNGYVVNIISTTYKIVISVQNTVMLDTIQRFGH